MNCDEAKRHWHERLDGARADAGLEEHLLRCAACWRYVAEMSLIVDSLEGLRRETETIVSTATAHADTSQPRQTPFRTIWLRRASGIAAMIVLTIAAWTYWRSPTTTPTRHQTVAQSDDPNATPLGITLRGQSARRFLAVADAESDANVQVFHLYPVLASAEPATSP